MRWVEIAQINRLFIRSNSDTPVFVTAVVTNDVPYVEFSLGDKALRLHEEFKDGDVVKVDFDKEIVYINGEERNKTIDLVKADFFWLHAGENEVKTIPAMQLDVKYNERWL